MYELIQKQVLSTSAASFVFNSIPQNYTDFKIFLSSRGSDGTGYGRIVFNSTIESTKRRVYGTGSSYGSDANSSVDFRVNGSDQTASTFGNAEITVFNYSNTNYIKSYLVDSFNENNATYAVQQMVAGRAGTTNPITRIDLIAAGGNFVAGSSATLYGVNRTSAIGKPKAIGGNITYSNGYWVHTFTGSGTFYAQQDLEIDALVVAGGGGAGSSYAGGGGAGGALPVRTTVAANSALPIAVGAGGAGRIPTAANKSSGYNGSSSVFGSNIAIGGGSGGTGNPQSTLAGPDTGGSGGGSGGYSNPSTNGTVTPGAAGTAGQGFAGGNGSNVKGAGGGGGAGAAGNNASSSTAGAGGIGIIWNGAYYAGGGGGGAGFAGSEGTAAVGGLGGGGNGSNSTVGGNGTANTGGGGGGGDQISAGGAGGSGVVIVRYRAD